jgi:predicted RNA-binding protein with PUA-like domain
MSTNWLFKEEPTHYSYDDLVRDGKTAWTGVRNPLAQKHLREVRKGDRIFFYHTGDEKAVVGICKAAGPAYVDPADTSGKLHAVDVEPVKKLKTPVTLAAVKADKRFASFPLTRMPRLSVMPVDQDTWDAIIEMSQG